MGNLAETRITSGEIGIVWMSYMTKVLIKQMCTFFAQKTTEQKAKDILTNYVNSTETIIQGLRDIFDKEKAVIPKAFDSKDVFMDAPSLFDDIFHIMFLRTMAKGMLGLNAVHEIMSYRKDVRDHFSAAMQFSRDIYNQCTDYLSEQGVLTRPPHVTMPKQVEFIESRRYMSGIQVGRGKRALNTLEIAYIFEIIEGNIFGMQLMTGFAQVAKEKEVRDYFTWGKELAKKVVSDLSSAMLDSDIHAPATWAGKATNSTIPPFSDKVMLYITNIISGTAIAGNALGSAFSIRSDLPLKLGKIMLESARFTKDGGKLMITHKWLEEPPQMEDRNQLINYK